MVTVTPSKSPQPPHTQFGRALRAELDRADVSVRELARRWKPEKPEDARTNLHRYLSDNPGRAVTPGQRVRQEIAEALGLESSAFDADEEDAMAALMIGLRALVREAMAA